MQLVCNTRRVMVALSSAVMPSQNANKLLAIPDVRAFPLYCSDEHRDSILNEHRQCQLDSKQPSLKGSGVFCKINCSQFQIKGIITPRKQCQSILPETSFFRESRKMWKYLSLNFLADIETVCCSLKKVPLEVQCLFYVPCFGIAWQLKNSTFLPWKQQFCESVLVVSFYFVLFQEEFLFTLFSVKGVCIRRWTKNILYLGTPDRGHSLMVALTFWGKHKRWLCQMS